QWLRADLARWARTLDGGSELDCNLAKKMLTRWRVEPDLVGVFETSAPEELSADEREYYLALLHELGAVGKRIARLERAFALQPRNTDYQRESRALLSREGQACCPCHLSAMPRCRYSESGQGCRHPNVQLRSVLSRAGFSSPRKAFRPGNDS